MTDTVLEAMAPRPWRTTNAGDAIHQVVVIVDAKGRNVAIIPAAGTRSSAEAFELAAAIAAALNAKVAQ